MIREVALIEVKPGEEALFEQAVAQAAALFQRAKGCVAFELQREVEHPSCYRLYVGWQTVEDHTVHFRQSDDFQAWRELAGPYFAAPPQVSHVHTVLNPF